MAKHKKKSFFFTLISPHKIYVANSEIVCIEILGEVFKHSEIYTFDIFSVKLKQKKKSIINVEEKQFLSENT